MKKIGIFGTGSVGKTIASKMIALGYEVKMGARSADNEKAAAWVKSGGSKASQGTFTDAAAFGDIVFNCTKGDVSQDVIKLAAANLAGKILIDISNPLDFSNGMPPTLIPALSNTNSLGEALQELLPDTHVVKTLNIVTADVMVDAARCGGEATMLMAGNNTAAKKEVEEILRQFGWSDIIDLGNIRHARSTEMMLPVWLSVYLLNNNAFFGFKIVRP
ncbi:MAG TPA: NAD(P)-binding domain-containing protein [Chitinophaga sp.]|uniref:NADPH-dependent F420 reductase n=1 Tax=Chitinophaga sp. TaxID=1869181 RepID=UPI002C810696|nr:NAD(P)-binding domain-containing protein [Chitinophaga sp.]HVI49260.1 NAD(P)-binding domain-containing protein [Chitinophaga sp.]